MINGVNEKKAYAYIDSVNEWQGGEGETDATMIANAVLAQTHATLALLDEMRLANRIARITA